ncbi:MAG TPA: quinol dehydrogenase ferredoxin subunit NapH [Thermodesulfovibrionales bacterium]|nr:quinol dehydrogenase ferredoxin subunit NapH [Thermodesulfovibrionales bacterium]
MTRVRRLMKENKFLMARRIIQVAVLFFFFAGNSFGWNILKGNLSTARAFGALPLSDPFGLLQVLAAGSLVSMEAIAGALLVALVYAVVGGRAFCSWICPLNIITDAANWLKKILRIDTAGEWSMSRASRYWIMALSLVISALLGVAAFEWISPISMLHRGLIFGMGLGSLSVLAVFLFDLFLKKNGFCGHLCPLGGFYSAIATFSLIRVKHTRERCTLCMKCVDICPEQQVLHRVGHRTGFILSGECVNCGRCIDVCEEGALGFSNRLVSQKTSPI